METRGQVVGCNTKVHCTHKVRIQVRTLKAILLKGQSRILNMNRKPDINNIK